MADPVTVARPRRSCTGFHPDCMRRLGAWAPIVNEACPESDPLPPERALRLTLVCQAATAATRRAAFPDDEPAEAGALGDAAGLSARLPASPRAWTSPAQAARQTAAALGLEAVVEPALRDCDYGAWRGLDLDAVPIDALAAWRSDLSAAPHGGEPLAALCARVGAWLAGDLGAGAVAAVASAPVVRAAVLHVMDAPVGSFWRIDVAPLAMVRLHRVAGRWSLHLDPWRRRDGGMTEA